MNELTTIKEEDPLLNHMKQSRKGASVLKMDLVTLKSQLTNTLILVFEGIEDKGVYFHWLKIISPDIKYEPFPCNGKSYVLELRKVVDRDLNEIGKGVYFFVDRDFDDLRGEPSGNQTFMTDQYSVENYLVTEGVLLELLKNEYHCHGQPQIREIIRQAFIEIYDKFLEATTEINFLIFCARKLKIRIKPSLPDRIGKIVAMNLNDATPVASASEIINMARDLTPDEASLLRVDFDKLDKKERYRGKFAYLFFIEWLKHLAEDRTNVASTYFPEVPKNIKIKLQSLTLDNLASKSKPPQHLADFVRRMSA